MHFWTRKGQGQEILSGSGVRARGGGYRGAGAPTLHTHMYIEQSRAVSEQAELGADGHPAKLKNNQPASISGRPNSRCNFNKDSR